jgi:hypothetical protein
LNFRPQSIRLGTKWIAQLDHIELAESLPHAACRAQHLCPIDSLLAVPNDRQRAASNRITSTDRDRRLAQPRGDAERT